MSAHITRREIEPVLKCLPFKHKIEHLWDNPSKGWNLLYNLKINGGASEIYPNCFGSVLFVLDLEREFLQGKKATEDERVLTHVENWSSFAVFPRNFDSPGSLQSRNMKQFLDKRCALIDKPESGCIVTTLGYGELMHSAVFLGGENAYVFEQNGLRGNFRFDSLEELGRRGGIDRTEFYRFS